MKSKMPTAALMIGLMTSIAAFTGPADAAGAPVKVAVSAAHSYDLVGPVKFETLFEQMAGFISPTVLGSAPDGAFTFLAKSAASSGGVVQVKFVGLQAGFSAECEVGNTGQVFEIVLSDGSGGGVEKLTAASQRVGARTVLLFQSKPMRGVGDFVIRIASSTAPQNWNLYRCDITVTAVSKTPMAPTVKVN